MQKNKELKEEDIQKVSGGEVSSANIVGYEQRPTTLNQTPDTQNWNTSVSDEQLDKVTGGDQEPKWRDISNGDPVFEPGSRIVK